MYEFVQLSTHNKKKKKKKKDFSRWTSNSDSDRKKAMQLMATACSQVRVCVRACYPMQKQKRPPKSLSNQVSDGESHHCNACVNIYLTRYSLLVVVVVVVARSAGPWSSLTCIPSFLSSFSLRWFLRSSLDNFYGIPTGSALHCTAPNANAKRQ